MSLVSDGSHFGAGAGFVNVAGLGSGLRQIGAHARQSCRGRRRPAGTRRGVALDPMDWRPVHPTLAARVDISFGPIASQPPQGQPGPSPGAHLQGVDGPASGAQAPERFCQLRLRARTRLAMMGVASTMAVISQVMLAGMVGMRIMIGLGGSWAESR